MKQILLFLFICALSSTIQAQRVTNVDWKLDEAAEKIYITYDLNKENDKLYFDIAMKVIINGKTITPKTTTVAGEVGKFQRIGKGKKIAWDVREYADQLDGANIQFQIIASTDNDPKTTGGNENTPMRQKPKNIPVYAGLGTVATTGLGLMIAGITTQNSAKDDYDKSVADINSNSNLTATEKQTKINEAFEDFNPKYNKGQGLLYGGLGVFAISSGIIIYRIYWNKKLQNRYGDVYPIFEPKLPQIGIATATIGIGYRKSF